MRRRGSVLLEVSLAAGIVAMAMIAIAQLLAVAAQQERAIEQRRVAAQEAANALEQLLARPWSDLIPERLADVTLSENSIERLPSGQLICALEESTERPSSKRITATVSWQNRGGQEERVRFSAWRFQQEATP